MCLTRILTYLVTSWVNVSIYFTTSYPAQFPCRTFCSLFITADTYSTTIYINSVAWVRERTIPTDDSRLSAKLVPTFADRGCHVVSVTDPYGRILAFLDRSRYFFFQVAPRLYSRGWVDHVPDSLLLRKSCSAANRIRASGSVARNSWLLGHRGGHVECKIFANARTSIAVIIYRVHGSYLIFAVSTDYIRSVKPRLLP
jgi:hypothetical protein